MKQVILFILCCILIILSKNCKDMSTSESTRFTLNCTDISQNPETRIVKNGFTVEVFHRDGEPVNANRIMITKDNLEIEILPSKGLSIGKTTLNGKPVLWDAPIGLPDPDGLDFSSKDIYIFGEQTPGFEYLKTFVGGIEFLGMTNWGMPLQDSRSGELLPLHGEVSNIPLETVEFELTGEDLTARGTIIYRTFQKDGSEKPWYKHGEEMYRITKTLIINRETTGFRIADTIKNVSGGPLVPNWGYHVTFWPEAGSKLLVPSLHVEERGGGELPEAIDTWQPAEDERIRTEIGIIHKQLKSVNLAGTPSTRILKLYLDGRAFELDIPLSPYFQTWYSSGGSDYDEFTYEDGTPLFSKSWNGFGVEIGSSPLDHNGNIDASVAYRDTLEPGESMGIVISIQQLDQAASALLKKEIEEYNTERK